ncbi:Transposase [Burkholderia sp. WP9]|nr:Transposase [Burkholderia sp. WP9]
MGILAKIRRMYFREKVPLREIARRTGLSRNTVRSWLRQTDAVEPKYPKRVSPSVVDEWAAQLTGWLRADSHRPKRDRRTARFMFEAIRGEGYAGSYGRVSAFVRRWHEEQAEAPRRKAYVPLAFEPGEAFQFDWSCEYAFIGGLRRRLEVAHVKLNASRAFWLVAYPTQSHEMLFDAHARAFAAFGGVPRRGIYDNMKTAVDKVGRGKERAVNARFEAMCSHYLFEPDFCNRAAGWEYGVVKKMCWSITNEAKAASLRKSNSTYYSATGCGGRPSGRADHAIVFVLRHCLPLRMSPAPAPLFPG